MIEIVYKNATFNNCTFKNISCVGDSEDSSLIKYTSSDYGNSLILDGITIKNCNSNGDLIVINGNNSFVNISNVTINDVSSYGSLLNNMSTEGVVL